MFANIRPISDRSSLKKRILPIALAVMLAVTMMPQVAAAGSDEQDMLPGPSSAVPVPEDPENGIPLIIVNVNEDSQAIAAANEADKEHQYGTVAEMNGSEDHSVRCIGDVEIKMPEGYSGGYGASQFNPAAGNLKLDYIRGRGNSTWAGQAKRPYKIKFDKKQDLFGMGRDKEWALMANSYDPTLIRNRITSWLGEQMGADTEPRPFVPQMVPVEVVIKGSNGTCDYLGSYCISELVSTGDSRLNIKKLDAATQTEDPSADSNITGGYLAAFYTEVQNDDEPANSVFKTIDGLEYYIKEPETYTGNDESELTPALNDQRDYFSSYIQNVENRILHPGTSDGSITEDKHNRIAKMMDLKSLADYWLIQEFSKNMDAFETSSTYMYKDMNGKLYWGPLWDFDACWEDKDEKDVNDVSGFNTTKMKWIDVLRENDPLFVQLIKERWDLMRTKLIQMTQNNGIIDQYANEVVASQKVNARLWPDEPQMNLNEKEYNAAISTLKSYIDQRRQWFDDNIDSVNKTKVNITYKVDGKVFDTEKIRQNDVLTVFPTAPKKQGKRFETWVIGGTDQEAFGTRALKDMTLTAKYLDEKDIVEPTALYLNKYEEWIPLDDDLYQMNSEVRFVPENVTFNDIEWSSSNKQIAEVLFDGSVVPNKCGDVTITATHSSGISRSYLLHVYDPAKTVPVRVTGIKALPDNITLKMGEEKQLGWTLLPQGKALQNTIVSFETSDSSVVSADIFGVLTPKKAGTVTITLRAYPVDTDADEDDNAGQGSLSAKCKVTVVGTAPAKKKANTLRVKKKGTVKVKARKLKKKNVKIKRAKMFKVTNAQGKVRYKLLKAKKVSKKKNKKAARKKKSKKAKWKFKINKKNGNITVRKKLKKGTYKLKIRVNAAGNKSYRPANKTVTVKVRIK